MRPPTTGLARCAASIRPGAAHRARPHARLTRFLATASRRRRQQTPAPATLNLWKPHMTVTTVDVTTTRPRGTAIVIVYAIGVACWLLAPGGCVRASRLMPHRRHRSPGGRCGCVRHRPRRSQSGPSRWRCSSRGTALPSYGARPRLAMLAASVTRSGSPEAPRRHRKARKRLCARLQRSSLAHARRTAQPNSSACDATEQGCL
jgi:hypothetical protein